jgi:hypothetical protein
MVGAAGCGGGTEANTFELDIAVNAPGATAVLIDGTSQIPAVGGTYSRGFTSVNAAASVHGTVSTIDANGTVRASAPYELGSYCTAQMPLLRQTMHFVEASDASGNPALTLDSIECEKTNGTGVVVMP